MQESYEKSIKGLGNFKTVRVGCNGVVLLCVGGWVILYFGAQVQDFWNIYNHLVRPNDLPNTMDYHLFKTGIKPIWEDPANRRGGKWMVRLRKGIASRYWEDLVRCLGVCVSSAFCSRIVDEEASSVTGAGNCWRAV